MSVLQSYYQQYPYLPFEISLFFSERNGDQTNSFKTVWQFCQYYSNKYNSEIMPQPAPVAAICDILCQSGRLSLINRNGMDNLQTSYFCMINIREKLQSDEGLQNMVNRDLSGLIYGFKYIYEDYSKFVLPVEYTNDDGDIYLGTCFLFLGGIVTARHCIEGAQSIAIRGISKQQLELSRYQIHENRSMDLIFISLNEPLKEPLKESISFWEKAEVLDEVIAMGYPKIAGYHNFLTVEAATVSSRFTVSVGQIVAEAEDIWMKEQLFLITARIKGGNSGGPVVKKNGKVVGVSVNLAQGEGDYDDLGYGTVIPINFVEEMILNEEKKFLDVSSIKFKEFD